MGKFFNVSYLAVVLFCLEVYHNQIDSVSAFQSSSFSRRILYPHSCSTLESKKVSTNEHLSSNFRRSFVSSLSSSFTSYVAVPIYDKISKRDIDILVKSSEKDLLKEIKSWKSKKFYSEEKINELYLQGLVLPLKENYDKSLLNEQEGSGEESSSYFDTNSMHFDTESNTISMYSDKNIARTNSIKLPKKGFIKAPKIPSIMSRSNIASYINIGTPKKPVYLKSSKQHYIDELYAKRVTIDYLIENSFAFSNLTELQNHEKKQNRFDSIATRVHDEYAMSDQVWQKWTNKTTELNATSLTQVIAEYFQTQSIGDIGGKTSNYVPKRGYPGTLAPGELFKDNDPLEKLSKHILHPWPSLQEIQFHGRMPVTHPMIPPPVLWFGMNDMYTRNYTDWQLKLYKPTDLVLGGNMMTPKDAMIIARNSSFGESYNLVEQLPHGGSAFYNGFKIPFYKPDHGPTVSASDAVPPIPPELLPITERWYDPYAKEDFVYDAQSITETMTDEEKTLIEYAQQEEIERKNVFEKLYLTSQDSVGSIDDTSDDSDDNTLNLKSILIQDEVEKLQTQRAILERYTSIKENHLSKIRDLYIPDELEEDELDEIVTPSFTSVLGTGSSGSNSNKRKSKKSSDTTDATAVTESDYSKQQEESTMKIADSESSILSSDNIVSIDSNSADYSYLENISDDNVVLTTEPHSTDDEWMIQAKGEIEIEKNVNRATMGFTRSPKQLLKYTVEFMRDLKRDMDRGEIQSQINTGARKRTGKRRKARKSNMDDDDDLAVLDIDPSTATGASLSDSDSDVQALAGLGLGADSEPDFSSADGDSSSIE